MPPFYLYASVQPDEPFDIAIVGAGPAGATCLLALAGKGLRVLVLEKVHFPREKACGDAVPGLALKVWEELAPNLAQKLTELPSAKSLSDGFVAGPNGASCQVQFVKPGLMVTRAELDAALFDYAQSVTPCTVAFAGVKDIEQDSLGFYLTLTDGQRFFARRLAAADGANGPCRKALTGKSWESKEVSVAVRGYVRQPITAGVGADALALWFDKRVLPGYFWAFPLQDGTLNVGVGILGHKEGIRPLPLKKALADWLNTQALDLRPLGTIDASSWLGQILPLGKAGRPISGAGFCLLGDAGGLIAPATGDGIGQAALSGKLAAEALAQSLIYEKAATVDYLSVQFDNAVYARLGASFTAQRQMIALGKAAPWALNAVIKLASKSAWLRKRLTSL